jgi:hypothetical protein
LEQESGRVSLAHAAQGRVKSAAGPLPAGRMPIVAWFLSFGVASMADNQTNTWPDLLIGLYDNLTGRRAEISYEFDDMHIKIPSGTGPSAQHAEWILHGTLKIRTRDTGTHPN